MHRSLSYDAQTEKPLSWWYPTFSSWFSSQERVLLKSSTAHCLTLEAENKSFARLEGTSCFIHYMEELDNFMETNTK